MDLTPENITLLQQLIDLSIDAQEDCPVCMDIIFSETARITICKHIFCMNCIETVIRTQQKCPMCRTQLSSPEKCLVAPAVEVKQEDENEGNSLKNMGESSSKLDALVRILEGLHPSSCRNFTLILSPAGRYANE